MMKYSDQLVFSLSRLLIWLGHLVLAFSVIISWHAIALTINGQEEQPGQKSGIVVLYEFNETTGEVLDTSGVGTPLNLTIDNPGAVIRGGGTLDIESPTLIHSSTSATKIVNACKASNEMTIEAWIENNHDHPVRPKPVRIVTLSNKAGNGADQLSSTNRNFFLGQDYVDSNRFHAVVRTTNSRDGAPVITAQGVSKFKELQHVYVTRDSSGVVRLFVSDEYGVSILREQVLSNETRGNFGNWDSNMILGIGNEISYRDPAAATDEVETKFSTEERAWMGKIHLLAIYCRALSPTDIAGEAAPGNKVYPAFKPVPGDPITEGRKKAMLIYKRLVGVSTSIDNPVIKEMGNKIDANKDLLGAAEIASLESDFYNITVRDFAGRMSTRDETVNAPLSDFVATVVGVTRDNLNAKLLLTGNFTYQGDPRNAAVVRDTLNDIVTSNNHYDALASGNFDLKRALIKVDGQKIYNGAGGVVDNPDPAGVLTSRAFMEAHATAGTNRRIVQYAFKIFLCKDIAEFADAKQSDNWVGRDVDRFPGGDNAQYAAKCSACHSVMDSLRNAFARYDFSNEVIKYAPLMPDGGGDDRDSMAEQPSGISSKMNRNNDTFPGGLASTNDRFVNYVNSGANKSYFGWGSIMSGSGASEFGAMLSQSKAFPLCMAHRVFRSVCKREPMIYEEDMLKNAANDFVGASYNLRELFKRISVTTECLGQ